MTRQREDKVQEVRPKNVPSFYKRHAHAQRTFIIVTGPPAIKVNPYLTLRLFQNPVNQIVLKREGARHAGYPTEDVWPLPGSV